MELFYWRLQVLKQVFSLIILLMVGCATAQPVKEELRFFHDQDRGDVRFICWRTDHLGWQCERTFPTCYDKKWQRVKKVIKLEGSGQGGQKR